MQGIEQNKDKELIAKIYQSFVNREYSQQSMAFYVKTGRLILQNTRGDFSLAQ
jgi:hypothetical protein